MARGSSGHRQGQTTIKVWEPTAVASDKSAFSHQVVTTWLCSVSDNAKVPAPGRHGLQSRWPHSIRSRIQCQEIPSSSLPPSWEVSPQPGESSGRRLQQGPPAPRAGQASCPTAHSSSPSWEADHVRPLRGPLCSLLICMAGKSFTLSGPQFLPPLSGHKATCYRLN